VWCSAIVSLILYMCHHSDGIVMSLQATAYIAITYFKVLISNVYDFHSHSKHIYSCPPSTLPRVHNISWTLDATTVRKSIFDFLLASIHTLNNQFWLWASYFTTAGSRYSNRAISHSNKTIMVFRESSAVNIWHNSWVMQSLWMITTDVSNCLWILH